MYFSDLKVWGTFHPVMGSFTRGYGIPGVVCNIWWHHDAWFGVFHKYIDLIKVNKSIWLVVGFYKIKRLNDYIHRTNKECKVQFICMYLDQQDFWLCFCSQISSSLLFFKTVWNSGKIGSSGSVELMSTLPQFARHCIQIRTMKKNQPHKNKKTHMFCPTLKIFKKKTTSLGFTLPPGIWKTLEIAFRAITGWFTWAPAEVAEVWRRNWQQL